MKRRLSQPPEQIEDDVLDSLISAALEQRVANAIPAEEVRRRLLAEARLTGQAPAGAVKAQPSSLHRFDPAYFSASGRPVRPSRQRHYSYLMLTLSQFADPVRSLIR